MDKPTEQPRLNQPPCTTAADAGSRQEITGHCKRLKTRRAPLAAKMHAILTNPNATKHERKRAKRWDDIREERLMLEEMKESEATAAAVMQAEMDKAGFGVTPKGRGR